MSIRRPYQFSVRRLLFLTTAIAVAFAFASGMPAPRSFQIGFGLYLAWLIASYVMWPAVHENWRVNHRRRLVDIQRRREMAIEAAQRKRDAKVAVQHDVAPSDQPQHGDHR